MGGIVTVRQWLWYSNAIAPWPAWLLSLALLLSSAVWTLQEAGGTDVESLQSRVDAAATSVARLQEQIEESTVIPAADAASHQVSEESLRLLLHHRCGIRQGMQLSRPDGKLVLAFRGESLEALCVMRSLSTLTGGIRQFHRKKSDAVDLVWESSEQ